MDNTYRRQEPATWCLINGEGFVSSRRHGTALSLNRSGVQIWNWLSDGRTLMEIDEALCRLYGESSSTSEDVNRFLSDLDAHDLIATGEDRDRNGPIDVPERTGDAYARPAIEALDENPAYVFA